MKPVHQNPQLTNPLKTEIKLQINQQLFERGVISREVYEQAKVKIVAT